MYEEEGLATACRHARSKECGILLQSQAFDGAYYLAGYAVECRLKACVAKQLKEHDFPDRKLVNDSYTHDLEKLVEISGIKTVHEKDVRHDPKFAVNWNAMK